MGPRGGWQFCILGPYQASPLNVIACDTLDPGRGPGQIASTTSSLSEIVASVCWKCFLIQCGVYNFLFLFSDCGVSCVLL